MGTVEHVHRTVDHVPGVDDPLTGCRVGHEPFPRGPGRELGGRADEERGRPETERLTATRQLVGDRAKSAAELPVGNPVAACLLPAVVEQEDPIAQLAVWLTSQELRVVEEVLPIHPWPEVVPAQPAARSHERALGVAGAQQFGETAADVAAGGEQEWVRLPGGVPTHDQRSGLVTNAGLAPSDGELGARDGESRGRDV